MKAKNEKLKLVTKTASFRIDDAALFWPINSMTIRSK